METKLYISIDNLKESDIDIISEYVYECSVEHWKKAFRDKTFAFLILYVKMKELNCLVYKKNIVFLINSQHFKAIEMTDINNIKFYYETSKMGLL